MNQNPSLPPMPQVHGLAIGSVYALTDVAKAFKIGSGAVRRMIPPENRRVIGGRCYVLFDVSVWVGLTEDPCRDKRAGFEEMRVNPIADLFESACPPVVTESEAARLLGVASWKRVRSLHRANLIEGASIRGVVYISTASLRVYAESRTTGQPQAERESAEHAEQLGREVTA